MNYKLHIIPMVLFSVLACNKIDLQTADTNVPVVECYISPNEEISVKIVKQLVYNSSDTTTVYLDDLSVSLSDDSATYILRSNGSGIYTNTDIKVEALKEYNIEFNYNDKIVFAETVVPEKPDDYSTSSSTIEVFSFENFTPGSGTPPERPSPITLSWLNTNTDYHMIVVECIEDNPNLITESSDRPPRLFRNMPTLGTSQELDPMSFSYYGKHQAILYKLNAEYAALYEQLGTSSLDITAPPSNITNGLGIFTGINADTLNLYVVAQ